MFEPSRANPPVAIALMVLASMLIAATTLLAKSLGTQTLGAPLPALQISHGRFLFAFLGIASVALVLRPPLRSANLKLHVARSSFGWLGITLLFGAVAFIPLSDATAISFLNPVFAMMLAIVFLGEKVGRIRWSAAGIALIGALILLRPSAESFQPAALLALTAAFVMGIEITIIKLLSGREGPLQILLINNAIGLTIATIAVLAVWTPPTGAQWLALAGIGLLMAMAQACFVNALARAESSMVVPFSYSTLVFATLYDLLIYDVVPDAVSITGAAIIIAGAAMLAWREARLRQNSATLPTGKS